MRLVLQLYIDTSGLISGEPNYEKLDFFDYETIELTSSLQDVKDIGNIFTDYSQEFTVPSSTRNDRILKHFYNVNLIDGFDARIKQRGIISLNGITFREGYIRLSKSSVKKGRTSTYSLTFFGQLINLKQAFGDDEISGLVGLSKYNHIFSNDNVYNGFVTGLGYVGGSMVESTNRDVIYPSISASDRWYYDSTAPSPKIEFNQGYSANLYTGGTDDYGIEYTQLKPAIKVKHIITAIEETYGNYGVVFSEDFFNSVDFNQLYLLMHNSKGVIGSTTKGEQSRTYAIGTEDDTSDFKYTSGDGELRPIITKTIPNQSGGTDTYYYNLTCTVSNTVAPSGVQYSIELVNNENVIDSVELTGDGSLTTFISDPSFYKEFPALKYRIKTVDGGLATFKADLHINHVTTINEVVTNYDSDYSMTDSIQAMVSEINITSFLPKIKVYDFVKGLFNAFNLTAIVEDGVIVVKTLDNFYSTGNVIDLSNQINSDEHSIKRMDLYSNIDFSFATPKTFGVINQNEVNQDTFGDLEFEGRVDNIIFDGTKYTIKLPFEKLFFDRLSDENPNGITITSFSNGWLTSKDQNDTITSPVLFFNKPTNVPLGQQIGFVGKTLNLGKYNRASNSNINETSTIHFGEEIDEYTGISITGSLFDKYYKNYVSNIFDRSSRIFTFNAVLNLNTLLSYKMNDIIVVNERKFRINNIRTDLTTGISELELITDFDVEITPSGDITPPTVPTGLNLVHSNSDSLDISWIESTDNVGVAGYEVWLNGFFKSITPITSEYRITGLDPVTSYDVQLLAFDEAGNKSALSTLVNMNTVAVTDNTAPTAPSNLSLVYVTSYSARFEWEASTDNVGVVGYYIYKDGVLVSQTSDTITSVTFLDPNTNYNFKVAAYDAAGNVSVFSSNINVTTLN